MKFLRIIVLAGISLWFGDAALAADDTVHIFAHQSLRRVYPEVTDVGAA